MSFSPCEDCSIFSSFAPSILVGFLWAIPGALFVVRRQATLAPIVSANLRTVQWVFGAIAGALTALMVVSWVK